MKHKLLFLVALAALAPAGFAQDVQTAQKAIQAQYDKRSAAALKKDIAGSLAINTSEFVSIGLKGDKRTIEQLKPEFKQVFEVIKSYSITTKITQCIVKGETATVSTREAVVVVTKSTQESESTSEDLWVKKNGQWLRTQNKLLSTRIKPSSPGK